MSETFDARWLALREPVDHRSRNRDVSEALAARFALREEARVIDIGAGTGANLRATFDSLPESQTWTLVDHDARLLDAARSALATWADDAGIFGRGLKLKKGHRELSVNFRQLDLAANIEALIGDEPVDLVTASAFFDLTSADFIRRFARAVSDKRSVFYTVLTYNGIQRWKPHRPLDNQMSAAFHRHQMGDKGLGPATGPLAAAHLADQFRLHGYSVAEGDSPWVLDRADQNLIDELAKGHVRAVRETGVVDEKALTGWEQVQRHGAIAGHTDTLAVPGV